LRSFFKQGYKKLPRFRLSEFVIYFYYSFGSMSKDFFAKDVSSVSEENKIPNVSSGETGRYHPKRCRKGLYHFFDDGGESLTITSAGPPPSLRGRRRAG
jgi:hypothetical protein